MGWSGEGLEVDHEGIPIRKVGYSTEQLDVTLRQQQPLLSLSADPLTDRRQISGGRVCQMWSGNALSCFASSLPKGCARDPVAMVAFIHTVRHYRGSASQQQPANLEFVELPPSLIHPVLPAINTDASSVSRQWIWIRISMC